MPLRKTEARVLAWLVLHAEAYFKYSNSPKARLLKRGLIEETQGGLVRITNAGREELRNWKGIV
jgi:hypothetical protein